MSEPKVPEFGKEEVEAMEERLVELRASLDGCDAYHGDGEHCDHMKEVARFVLQRVRDAVEAERGKCADMVAAEAKRKGDLALDCGCHWSWEEFADAIRNRGAEDDPRS